MTLHLILDLMVILPLLAAFYILWRERKTFHSVVPIIISVILLILTRVCEFLTEHWLQDASVIIGISEEAFRDAVSIAGGLCDVSAVLILTIGFIKTLAYQHTQRQTIKKLESLLPICARCKKYRTDDKEWRPIEEYLTKDDITQLTHSLCPECAAQMREEAKAFAASGDQRKTT